jgi:hypothetical protein
MTPPAWAPRRRPGVLVGQAEGQTVLLRPDDGSYYALKDVGSRIWELCDGERSIDQIADAISAEFDAPLEMIRADVRDLLTELRGEHLLVEHA